MYYMYLHKDHFVQTLVSCPQLEGSKKVDWTSHMPAPLNTGNIYKKNRVNINTVSLPDLTNPELL